MVCTFLPKLLSLKRLSVFKSHFHVFREDFPVYSNLRVLLSYYDMLRAGEHLVNPFFRLPGISILHCSAKLVDLSLHCSSSHMNAVFIQKVAHLRVRGLLVSALPSSKPDSSSGTITAVHTNQSVSAYSKPMQLEPGVLANYVVLAQSVWATLSSTQTA